jgi:CheY-like chemotaxis protein
MNATSHILKSVSSPHILLESKNVFLIDGSNDVYGLSSYLNAYGAYSYIATNCLSAFTKLEELSNLELIVIDANTKGVNAFEMLRTLKTRKPFENIPVLIVSRTYHAQEREKYLSGGAVDYVHKSEELDFLILKINHVINTPSLKNRNEICTVLELFVDNSSTLKAKNVIFAVKNWLKNNYVNKKYELKIVDVAEEKRWALRRKIVVTPMLLKIAPNEQRSFVDNWENMDAVFEKLNV